MRVSEIVQTADQWQTVLRAAGGDIDRAKVLLAIGWHETNFGRTVGYGQEGYTLGVGAWGGGQQQFLGLPAQLAWTVARLPALVSLEWMQWYGVNVQKPTAADGTNTGDAWGRSVYSIFSDMEVDLPADQVPGQTLRVGDVTGALTQAATSKPWAFLLVAALLAWLGFEILGGGE